MAKYLAERTERDVAQIHAKGDHRDSRKAAWFAIGCGSQVIRDIQLVAQRHKEWLSLEDAMPYVNEPAKQILTMRIEAIESLKRAPHHRYGFRNSRYAGARKPRPVNALCLISGHEGQEIPGLVRHDRVVVDAEHMEQALGPATITEILGIRKRIGEYVYISTNVSESPQLVFDLRTGKVDTRGTAALTASKVIAALEAGADIVKVGFAHTDEKKKELTSEEALKQMKIVRKYVDEAVKEKAIVMPLNQTGRFPLVSVFFPEMGIDSNGEPPMEIARKGLKLTAEAGWQGLLIDTYEKFTGRNYWNFYSLEETAQLAAEAHKHAIEFWVAGSIIKKDIPSLVKCKVDLICFGGAARHESGIRVTEEKGRRDESIKRPLVEGLVRAFERNDMRRK